MRGPIDYIIVGFEGNKFDGSVLKAVADAIDDGVIALVELSIVIKDAEGVVGAVSIADVDDSQIKAFSDKYPSHPEIVSDEDVEEIGELLENNTSAGFMVIEQLWAIPLKKALIEANGVLVAEGRIHPEGALELDEGDK